jgi:hypothetical protein
MRPTTPEADDLDLPPLDGTIGGADVDEENEGIAQPDENLDADAANELGDAFDDSTGEGDALEEITVEGAEGGWLVDADDANALDVGVFDFSLSDETRLLDEEEPEVRHGADEELGADEEAVHADGGEEGPLADDEELREEDLPALDADEDGDVDDASLYEGNSIGLDLDEGLRWDDRAWARVGQTRLPAVEIVGTSALDDADDSGMLSVPGDDPKLAARDATWRRLEETGRVTAAAFVPGESVVVALEGPERPMLVRILPDGLARIIAEIESSAADDELEACRVVGLRWDGARGSLVVTGTFGAQAFRPA